MNERLSSWVAKAKRLESSIAARIEGTPRPSAASSVREPLEVLHAVLDAIEAEVLPASRGRSVFPYTEVQVLLAAPTKRDEARLAAAFDGPPSLHARAIDRLAGARCTVTELVVTVSFVSAPGGDWQQPDFRIDCLKHAPAPAAPQTTVRLELTVTHGTAEREVYTFEGPSLLSITIGRGSEVRDSRQRLLQTNLVAFGGDGDVNQSISRRHARIEHDANGAGFRLHDDTGGEATSLVRAGRGLQVPRGRGLTLLSGDVLVLGRARVAVKIAQS